jgi:hypothetical protein
LPGFDVVANVVACAPGEDTTNLRLLEMKGGCRVREGGDVP